MFEVHVAGEVQKKRIMPFVQRVIEPKYLSKTSLFDANGKPRVLDDELEAVTNNTLSNALRQLASLVLAADDIFTEFTRQLKQVAERSAKLKGRIEVLETKVTRFDPKKVAVRKYHSHFKISLRNLGTYVKSASVLNFFFVRLCTRRGTTNFGKIESTT